VDQNQRNPLKTVEAGRGFADMEPLTKIVGNARIVALGEATHGTREFFRLKPRMIEFLATRMGFTILLIEANMPEAYRLNDYVVNGKGDPAHLLKGMYFWTWDTKKVLDMEQQPQSDRVSRQEVHSAGHPKPAKLADELLGRSDRDFS
jgi:erythromycin esterase